MLGSHLRKALKVCEHSGETVLLEIERRKRRGPDPGMSSIPSKNKEAALFLPGLLFSPPVIRSLAGEKEGSGMGSCMT